jgi:hypothetical protein
MEEQPKPGQPRAGPPIVPNPQMPTVRATNVLCYAENGAFTLTFYDNRVAANTVLGAEFTQRAWYEVVKLELSPVTFAILREVLNDAGAFHEKMHGALMSNKEYQEKLKAMAIDKYTQNLINKPADAIE